MAVHQRKAPGLRTLRMLWGPVGSPSPRRSTIAVMNGPFAGRVTARCPSLGCSVLRNYYSGDDRIARVTSGGQTVAHSAPPRVGPGDQRRVAGAAYHSVTTVRDTGWHPN